MESIFMNAERCMALKAGGIICALNRSSLSRQLPEAIYETVQPLPRVRVASTGRRTSLAKTGFLDEP